MTHRDADSVKLLRVSWYSPQFSFNHAAWNRTGPEAVFEY